MTLTEKMLGQIPSSGTTAQTLYTNASGETVIVRSIYISNVTSTAKTYSIFVDAAGSSYTTASSIAYNVTIDGGTTTEFNTYICIDQANGSLGVSSSDVESITFSAFGAVIS